MTSNATVGSTSCQCQILPTSRVLTDAIKLLNVYLVAFVCVVDSLLALESAGRGREKVRARLCANTSYMRTSGDLVRT